MPRLAETCRRWRYLLLLIALLTLLVVEPIASAFGVLESLFDGLLVFVMAVLALALARDKPWGVLACVFCMFVGALSIGSHFMHGTAQEVGLAAAHVLGALFFLAVTAKIVSSVLTAPDLSIDSVFGAICGYLLLGVAWGLAYAMIDTLNPESFQFEDSMRQGVEQVGYRRHVFLYYSFVTLTTVGYGDVLALSIPARTLSWVEALVGQLYLAVLIAGLIGALIAKRAKEGRV